MVPETWLLAKYDDKSNNGKTCAVTQMFNGLYVTQPKYAIVFDDF